MRNACYLFAALVSLTVRAGSATNEVGAVPKPAAQILIPPRLYTDDEALLFSRKLKSLRYPTQVETASQDIGIDFERLRGWSHGTASSYISSDRIPPLCRSVSLQLSPLHDIRFFCTAPLLRLEASRSVAWDKECDVYWVEIAPRAELKTPINTVEPTPTRAAVRDGSP